MKSVNRLSFLVEVDQDHDLPVKDPAAEAAEIATALTSESVRITVPVHVEYRGYKLVTVS